MSEQDFDVAWRADLASGVLGVQLVEVDHPLEVYVGASDLGLARLQIRTRKKPILPKFSDVVMVDLREVGSAWLLTLTLQEAEFQEVFVRLAVSVVDRTRPASSEVEALELMDRVLEMWRRLLKPAAIGRLSLEALRGLVGELWFLIHRCAVDQPWDAALAGWNGPLGDPQDFWYQEKGFFELKSVGPTATAIEITSEAQLDANPLQLVVLTVPQVSERDAGALSLVDLVDAVKRGLRSTSVGVEELDLKLRRLGVDMTDPYYADTYFGVAELAYYSVDPEFPGLFGSRLPAAVERVKYRLRIAELESHKHSVERVSGGSQ